MVILSPQLPDSAIEEWAAKYLDKNEPKALAAAEKAKTRGSLQYDEFLQIAMWKSTRPARFYEKNSERDVEELTRRALACRHDLECVVILTNLAGVRVRTATAILHLCHPAPYPLLDVWAMSAMGVSRDTTAQWDDLRWLQIWPDYVRTCRDMAIRTGRTMREIDKALWAFGEDRGKKSQ